MGMTDYNDPNHRALIERFERTERDRERKRQIDYQNALGPVKTWREIEIERLDRLDAIWKKTKIRG
jgi:hypothetical protein